VASKNEKAAEKLGMTLKEYKKSSIYKDKKRAEKKEEKSKKAEEKQIKKYYEEKTTDIESKAKVDTARLKEDLANIMNDSGIQQTRATEDYLRNIDNIENNKAADVDDLTEYVSTNTTRTGEDLETSLANESRRYEVEFDRTNQSLADAGLTFSERKQEGIDKAENVANVEASETIASRSFQDIARYEAVQNRDIELKYGQQTENAEATKTRTMEDILNDEADAKLRAARGEADIVTGQAIDIRNNDYAETGSLTDTADKYAEKAAERANQSEILNVKGN